MKRPGALLGSLLAFALALSLCLALPREDSYTSISGINVDAIFDNRRLMDSYLKCYLDKGPCTPPFKKAKKLLPELIATNCAKCTVEQRRMVKKAMKKLSDVRPQGFAEILAKYDTSRRYTESFKKWVLSP